MYRAQCFTDAIRFSMAIPQSQLESWSGKGADTTSAAAYDRVRNAILNGWPAGAPKPKIYLHGSYANDTNTRGDSDVDIVVEYGQTFGHDLSRLPPDHLQRWRAAFPNDASYVWQHVRRDTLTALRRAFPNAVTEGKKALKVQVGSGRMTADVVPSILYREYHSFHATPGTAFQGIRFHDIAGDTIINYPLIHIENGQLKNHATRTGGQYKATVRVFKNFRTFLIERNLLADGMAPSYFIECLLHNVPDNLFVGSLDSTMLAILQFLWNTPINGYVTQNGRHLLVGTGNTQWPEANALAFIRAAVSAWDNYR
jgi:hypothetical protein